MRSDYALIIAPAQDEEPKGFWAKVKATAGRVPMVETALAAWYCAIDEATPPHVKAVIFGALAYFVAPIDLIPDILAGMGFTDDAAVLAAVLSTNYEPHIQCLSCAHSTCSRNLFFLDHRLSRCE